MHTHALNIKATNGGDNKSYFLTIIMRHLCGVHWFINIIASGISQFPNIDFFDADILNWNVNEYVI